MTKPRLIPKGQLRTKTAPDIHQMELLAHELSKSRPHEAIRTLHKVLQLKKDRYGTEDVETHETQLDMAEVSITLALDLVQRSRIGEASRHIHRASQLTRVSMANNDQDSRRLFLRAQMFNCQTCLWRAKGDVRAALKYCEKGLSIMLRLNLLDQLPTSYLNVCALYSTLGVHAEALKHASLALQILRELIKESDQEGNADGKANSVLPTLSRGSTVQQQVHEAVLPAQCLPQCIGFEGSMAPLAPGATLSRLTFLGMQLAFTYFNIAVEQEYLLDFPTCIHTYQVAVTSAEDFLGPDHPLTNKFRLTFKKVLKDAARDDMGDNDLTMRRKAAKYQFGSTSVVSLPSVYKTNFHPEPPCRAMTMAATSEAPQAGVISKEYYGNPIAAPPLDVPGLKSFAAP